MGYCIEENALILLVIYYKNIKYELYVWNN